MIATEGFGAPGLAARAEEQKKKAPPAPAPAPVPAQNTAAIDVAQTPPAPGPDYVPCKLSLAELRLLQRPELAPTLDPKQVDQLQDRVIAAAEQEKPDPSVTGPAFTDLVRVLGSRETTAKLLGLTPSQALSKVIDLVRENRDSEATAEDVSWYLSIIEAAVSAADVTGSSQVPQEEYKSSKSRYSDYWDDADKSKKKPSVSEADALKKLLDNVREIRTKSTSVLKRPGLYPQVLQAVGASDLPALTKTFVLEQLGKSTPLDSSKLVDAARQFLESLSTPTDVGCSMSLMSWREVEYAFGYLIANEYIAVQVVVRNLNEKEQFVMHDVEFEVDADPTGRLGRFYSGRDKIVVRALANSQSTGDPRNLTLNTVTGIGQVMASAATIFGGSLTDASGVFAGAFLPALKIGWKDLSADQMKMIDDNTFSSAASSQTVVPKSGTVVFYTFIPSKQFEEGWWTQPCVDTIYLGRWDKKTGRIGNLSLGTYGQQMPDAVYTRDSNQDSAGRPATGGQANGQTVKGQTATKTAAGSTTLAGIDVRRALEICARDPNPLPRTHSHWSTMWKRGPMLKTKDEGKVAAINAPADDEPDPASGDPDPAPKGDKSGMSATTAPTTAPTAVDSQGNANSKPTRKAVLPEKTEDPESETGRYELFRNAYARPYRRWSGNSLAIFRELANTVVAGVHIVDQTDLVASVTQLDCGDQVDAKGVVDYDKVKNDSLSCNLIGKNLDKIAKVKLRNGADALDPATADSTVSVQGDSKKATVSWPVKTLQALPGTDYLLYAVGGANGAEQKTNAAVHLPDIPYATSVANTTESGTMFDLSGKGAKPLTLTVKGFRMDKVTGATLTPSVDTKSATTTGKMSPENQALDTRKQVPLKVAASPAQSATEVSFTLDATALKPLGDGGATISLKSSTATKPVELPSTLGITVKLTADAPGPAGGTPEDPNKKKKPKKKEEAGKPADGGKPGQLPTAGHK